MNTNSRQWFEPYDDAQWRCKLCPHQCVLRNGNTGRCRVRGVRDGQPVDLSYGQISAQQVDPIEKKPLFHFLPGSHVYSIGGYGCNFRCPFCQNWQIAQCRRKEARIWQPDEIVAAAIQNKCRGIAYTYNEPIIAYPFVMDTARLARKAGLCNILVTNGFIQQAPAAQLLQAIDAINLDIKSMEDAFYRNQCRGRLDPVLAFARQADEAGVHLEITNLMITGLNDAPQRVQELASWIATNLSPQTVLHITAYHPAFEMHIPRTPSQTILAARSIAQKHLTYVYCGNIPDHNTTQDTRCTQCGGCLVRRQAYRATIDGLLPDGTCKQCRAKTDIAVP
ncbi:MAG: AmmeMemoRadiSam system radical SAM enzyme [Kiritimatiellia bacterium]